MDLNAKPGANSSALGILLALSFSHLLNDSIQALIPAIYPLIKSSYALSFTQIGLITLTFQMAGSIFQPLVGWYTDRNPRPYSLVVGMACTFCGLVLLAIAPGYRVVLLAAAVIGLGSAVFHPESARMARLASGGRHGFAQSLFQVGGNAGTALGPLLAAWVIVPHGQRSILLFTSIAFAGIVVLSRVGNWYAARMVTRRARGGMAEPANPFEKQTLVVALTVLLVLMFSKFFYLACMTNYYTFFLIEKFGVSIQQSQMYLFLFLSAGAAGTMLGGPLGDRIGRRAVIWFSVFGIAPFALALPHANLFWTAVLTVIAGMITASAFPAILVYATELLPGKVGFIAGLFYGLAFGLAGIGSAVLGKVADATSVGFVVAACAFLPLLGALTVFLPKVER